MEQARAAIHEGNPARLPIQLEFGNRHEIVALTFSFPPKLRAAIEQQLLVQYPDCKIDFLRQDESNSHSPDHQHWTAELRRRPEIFPIREAASHTGDSSRSPQPLLGRRKAYFDSPVEGSGDSVQHGKRMAFIVGILQPADDRGGRSHEFGKLSLRQSFLRAKFSDAASHLGVGPLLFKLCEPSRVSIVVTSMQDLDRIRCGSSFFAHRQLSSYVCCMGFFSNLLFRATALSISFGGTARSLITP
jgi:hypothetical protein